MSVIRIEESRKKEVKKLERLSKCQNHTGRKTSIISVPDFRSQPTSLQSEVGCSGVVGDILGMATFKSIAWNFV